MSPSNVFWSFTYDMLFKRSRNISEWINWSKYFDNNYFFLYFETHWFKPRLTFFHDTSPRTRHCNNICNKITAYDDISTPGHCTFDSLLKTMASEVDSKPQKLIDIIKEKIENNNQFFSLEFYPPKTFNGATNLMGIIGRLNEHCTPLFCNITWKPSQDPMSDKCQQEPSTLLVSAAAKDLYGQDIMIHIPSANTTKSQVVEHLIRAKDLGIRSVLAVRGQGIWCYRIKPSAILFFHS